VAMLAWWAWRESGKRAYLALLYFAMALGMLAKGPVAPFLAGLMIALFAGAARDFRGIARTLWLPGILLFCAISLPWYIAVQMRNPEFLRIFILEHNLERFSSDLYHHREPFWYYLPVTALAVLPWVVFALTAFLRSFRDWWTKQNSAGDSALHSEQLGVFACCWLLVPMIFFSISESKLPGYILPAVPAAAVLLADYVGRRFEEQSPPPVSKPLVAVHALVAAAPFVPALLIAHLLADRRWPPDKPMYLAFTAALGLAVGIALTLLSKLGLRMLRFVTLIPVVLCVAAVLKIGAGELDRQLSARPLAREISSMETRTLPLAVLRVPRELEYGLAFYRNQRVVRYELGQIPAEEHLVVAPENWQAEVTRQVAAHTSGRRVSFLGHYAPQRVDYFWVSAAGAAMH